MITSPNDVPAYGVMRTTGVRAGLKLPELATNRFAAGASRRPAPLSMAGWVVIDTGEQPHADAKEESVTARRPNVQPASAATISKQLKVFVVMV